MCLEKNEKEVFIIAGAVPINPGMPSFATLILKRSNDKVFYAQCSSDGENISEFSSVKNFSKDEKFVDYRSNREVNLGSPMLIAFFDAKMNLNIMSKQECLHYFEEYFSDYKQYPFLQWTILSCLNQTDWIGKLGIDNVETLIQAFGLMKNVHMTIRKHWKNSKVKPHNITYKKILERGLESEIRYPRGTFKSLTAPRHAQMIISAGLYRTLREFAKNRNENNQYVPYGENYIIR